MNEPRVVESVTNECQSLGRAHESSSARAEQLIACLEGEIAKRDARIVELNGALKYVSDEFDCQRAELAALKEQYLELAALSPSSPLTIAAPVSEAKAQVYEPLVCDYCNAETQDPWHGSGMLNGVESRHIHACSQCRNLLPTTKAQGVVLDGSQLAGLLEQVRLDDDEAKPHGSGAAYWNNAVIACQVAIRDALAAPVQQVSVTDAAFRNVDQALDLIVGIRHGKNVTQNELWQACELLDAALAAHRAAPAPGGE